MSGDVQTITWGGLLASGVVAAVVTQILSYLITLSQQSRQRKADKLYVALSVITALEVFALEAATFSSDVHLALSYARDHDTTPEFGRIGDLPSFLIDKDWDWRKLASPHSEKILSIPARIHMARKAAQPAFAFDGETTGYLSLADDICAVGYMAWQIAVDLRLKNHQAAADMHLEKWNYVKELESAFERQEKARSSGLKWKAPGEVEQDGNGTWIANKG